MARQQDNLLALRPSLPQGTARCEKADRRPNQSQLRAVACQIDRSSDRTVQFPEEGSVSARVDYLVAAPRGATRLLTAVAAQLRRTRSRVVQQTMKGSDTVLLSAAVTAGLAQQAAAVVVVGAPGMDHDDVLVVESLAAHMSGRRPGNLSRLSKTMGIAELVASARRSRRQGKERV